MALFDIVSECHERMILLDSIQLSSASVFGMVTKQSAWWGDGIAVVKCSKWLTLLCWCFLCNVSV